MNPECKLLVLLLDVILLITVHNQNTLGKDTQYINIKPSTNFTNVPTSFTKYRYIYRNLCLLLQLLLVKHLNDSDNHVEQKLLIKWLTMTNTNLSILLLTIAYTSQFYQEVLQSQWIHTLSTRLIQFETYWSQMTFDGHHHTIGFLHSIWYINTWPTASVPASNLDVMFLTGFSQFALCWP